MKSPELVRAGVGVDGADVEASGAQHAHRPAEANAGGSSDTDSVGLPAYCGVGPCVRADTRRVSVRVVNNDGHGDDVTSNARSSSS